MPPSEPIGLRVLGGKTEKRRLVDWRAAFAGYANADEQAELDREAYLSHFWFPPVLFREYFEEQGGRERKYDGPCGADWIHWDIDREDRLEDALADARRLAAFISERYGCDDLLVFMSGAKGYHIGISTAFLGNPEPAVNFHLVAKAYALDLASLAAVVVDPMIYSKVRLLRAPNSKHAATGFHKRRLAFEELMHLDLAGITDRAKEPEAFEIPAPPAPHPKALEDWRRAALAVEERELARKQPAAAPARLQRATLEFIREGAEKGERADRLFKAAANLREFGAPAALVTELLEEAALDSGLSPKEVRKQISDGIRKTERHHPETIVATLMSEA